MTTQLRELEIDRQEESQAATVQPAVLPVEWVIECVRRDARDDAPQYLNETTVPKGGE